MGPTGVLWGHAPPNWERGSFRLSAKQSKGQTPQIEGDCGLFWIRVGAHQSHFVGYAN